MRRLWPGEPERQGDVHHDPDSGWSLRLFQGGAGRAEGEGAVRSGARGAAGDPADAPLQQMFGSPGPMRPGEYVTITEPDGREYGVQVQQSWGRSGG